jgi:NAD(P)-dependent dehydrogenase (short-subunit alcohol dehydrogenase family)
MFSSFVKNNLNRDFKNKTFILTGYSSGIGQQVYKDLNALGSKIILIGRKKIKNKNIFQCDLSDSKNLDLLCQTISKKVNKIDGFVHCAGINNCVKISDISINEWNKVFSVNLTSAFIISKNFKKNFLKSDNPSIVFVSSIAGHRKSVVSGSHYVSSKAGLIGLSKQLSHEFGKDKIRVNCISPSQTATKMLKKSMSKKQTKSLVQSIPLRRLASTKDQSNGILFLLSSLSSYISGSSINIDGGQI